jgi:hypothetical protein
MGILLFVVVFCGILYLFSKPKGETFLMKAWNVIVRAFVVAFVMTGVVAICVVLKSPVFWGMTIVAASVVLGVKAIAGLSFLIASAVGAWDATGQKLPSMSFFRRKRGEDNVHGDLNTRNT